MVISVIFLICTFPVSLLFVVKTIPVYERAVVFRLGRIKDGKASGPGLIYILPCIDKVINVDTRLKTFDVPPQSVSARNFGYLPFHYDLLSPPLSPHFGHSHRFSPRIV